VESVFESRLALARVIVEVVAGLMDRNLFPAVVGAKALVFMGPEGHTVVAERNDLVWPRHVRFAIDPQAGSLVGFGDLAEQSEPNKAVLGAAIAKLGDCLDKQAEWLGTAGPTKTMAWSEGFH
jgi:hypothetical protein